MEPPTPKLHMKPQIQGLKVIFRTWATWVSLNMGSMAWVWGTCSAIKMGEHLRLQRWMRILGYQQENIGKTQGDSLWSKLLRQKTSVAVGIHHETIAGEFSRPWKSHEATRVLQASLIIFPIEIAIEIGGATGDTNVGQQLSDRPRLNQFRLKSSSKQKDYPLVICYIAMENGHL